MALKRIVKQGLKLFFYFAIFLSPITFFPALVGTISGLMMAHFHLDKIKNGTRAMLSEIEEFRRIEEFDARGEQAFWDIIDKRTAPFYIPQLRSNYWAPNLGFVLPKAHYIDTPENIDSDPGIDKLASFEGAMRDVSCTGDYANEYWVYVADLPAHHANQPLSPWDAAFRRLLEYHEINPPATGAKFAYVKCSESPFLCNVWQVEPPALVHFLVRSNGSLDTDVNTADYDAVAENLRQVEVRIIDLGLQAESSPMVPGLFPSEFEQMKSLTANPGAYSLFDEYDEVSRELERFNKWFLALANTKGSLLDIVTECDNWTTEHFAKPLGLEVVTEVIMSLFFSLSLGIAYLFASVLDFFAGLPSEVNELEAKLSSI